MYSCKEFTFSCFTNHQFTACQLMDSTGHHSTLWWSFSFSWASHFWLTSYVNSPYQVLVYLAYAKDKKTLFSDNGHPSNYRICVPEADQVKTVQVASFYRQYFLRKNSVRCGNCRYKKLDEVAINPLWIPIKNSFIFNIKGYF